VILTAYEVSNLDLRKTELVVLSACETGLGDIKGGEGVFGLQRAFRLASAGNILMSLWSVPDKETRELMELFYSNWMIGMDIDEAFRKAQQSMRNKYPFSPEKWAGFVMVE
jgi:CHAT domain-containing protein